MSKEKEEKAKKIRKEIAYLQGRIPGSLGKEMRGCLAGIDRLYKELDKLWQ